MTSSDGELSKIKFRPGIHKNTTKLDAEGTFVSCDKVRFFYGLAEKIGGAVHETYTGSVVGVARDIYPWADLNNQRYLGIGTNDKLEVLTQGAVSDITPIVASATGISVFSTSVGSTLVRVSVNPQGAAVGDYFVLTSSPSSVGGINLTQGHQYVITSVGANFFQFDALTSATSGVVSAGGSVDIDFLLPVGGQSNTALTGWGGGTWGTPGISVCAGWSEPRTPASSLRPSLRLWSLDNYGQDLIATPYGGNIYLWNPSLGTDHRAVLFSSAAPSIVNICKIFHEGEHFVALGTHDEFGVYDSMLVRWSDSTDPTVWTAEVTNEAGDFRLQSGSFIVGVEESRQQFLIFTDSNVYTMQKIGGEFVFGFQDMGHHNGLMGQNAAIDVNGSTYWMGYKSFHMFNGVINTLPCDLQEYIFDADSPGSVNLSQKEKVFCATCRQFNEIWWLYPSRDSDEIDRYVIYNYLENTWYHGTWDRTVWTDAGIFSEPYAIKTDGTILVQETGFDDDASPLKSFVQTSFFDIKDGDKLMFVDRFVPDAKITKSLNLTLNYKKYPQALESFTKGPYALNPTTRKISTRLRGRQLQLAYSCSAQGASFRLGGDRLSIKPDGER